MTIDPASLESNLAKSLTAWIRAKLVTIEGLTVHIEDEPETSRPNEWVDVDYILDTRSQFGRHVSRTQQGGLTHGIVNLNLCKKRQSLTNIFALSVMADKAKAYFKTGQTIPINDYGLMGNPEVGRFLCYGITQTDVDDGRGSGVIVRNLSVNINYTEAYTLV